MYSLHFCFLCLSLSISLVHKHFTLQYSLFVFLLVKMTEIMVFYFYAMYMQNHQCFVFSTLVHYIFDLTVYQLLLDILSLLQYNPDDFRFNITRVGSREKLKVKIIFNLTLLAISFVSSVQFSSMFAGFFVYFHGFFLVIRILQCCSRDRQPKQTKK